MRIAKSLKFCALPVDPSRSARVFHRITKRFLPGSRVNFRKAGANYSPLQQNHPNRSINCRSNPLEKATPPNQAIRQQAPLNS
jgi:hypothetical protein